MGSFWRGFSKVIFWISFVGISIGAVIGGIAFINITGNGDYVPIGIAIMIGGLIVSAALHSFWGMALEFFDNVARIRKAVCKVQSDMKDVAKEVTAPAPAWFCTSCGRKNDGSRLFCGECGNRKE